MKHLSREGPAAAEAPERVLESWPKQSDLIPGKGQFRLAFPQIGSATVVRQRFFWIFWLRRIGPLATPERKQEVRPARSRSGGSYSAFAAGEIARAMNGYA